jgi:CelD/BcsL family acetyltransferase involved in cellulose biosynthesis
MGEISLTVVRPPLEGQLLKELIEVEKASWKWQQGTSTFAFGSRCDFIQGVLTDSRMPAQLWLLRLGQKLAAFELMLTSQTRWYGYMAEFRQDCRNAGSYLLAKVIEKACSAEVECVDLLRGDEDYKLAWTDVHCQVYEIVCPSNLRGRLTAIGYQAYWRAEKSPTLNRLLNRLRKRGDRR